nr:TIGR03943 family protein [Brevibacillus dissolubilis]
MYGSSEVRRVKRHYYVRSFLLLGFCFWLIDLIAGGTIGLYLAPRLHGLAYVTLVIMLLLTGVSLRQAIMGPAEEVCDCPGEHGIPQGLWRSSIVYGLFLLPVVMGLFMPDKILGSELAEKKGLNLLSGNSKLAAVARGEATGVGESGSGGVDRTSGAEEAGKGGIGAAKGAVDGSAGSPESVTQPQKVETAYPKTTEEIRKMFNSEGFGDFYTDLAVGLYQQPVIVLDDHNFLDGLTTLELYQKQFAGKKLETMGFIYTEPHFSEREFVVARFSVSCCTADAGVFGVMVELPEGMKRGARDSWVRVGGELVLRQAGDTKLLVLQAEKVTQVLAPRNPYVYYQNAEGGLLGQ